MKKWILILVVFAFAGAAGAYYWNNKKANAADSSATTYTSATADYRPMRQEVTSSGSVVSNQDVEIKCKATGQITLLPFDISDVVTEGDLLLKIDPIDEERNVRLAEVKLTAAQAKMDRAKQNLVVSEQELAKTRQEAHATLTAAKASKSDTNQKAQRMVTLLEKTYASQEEVDSAEVAAIQADSALQKAYAEIEGIAVEEKRLELLRQDIILAQTDVESNQIELEDAKQRMDETQVFAPMTGTISERLVQVGQIISSPTMNVGGGTSLLTLSDLSRLFVLASVDESDIGLVKQGQPASISVDAFPDMHFRGEVVRVATKGSLISNVVTFEVKIEVLDEARQMLLPEMTADVSILVASADKALAVPAEAVSRRSGQKIVLIPGNAGQEPVQTPVVTGIDDGLFIEIVSGLEEGATILIPENNDSSTSSDDKQFSLMGGPPRGGRGGGGAPPPPPPA